MDARSQALLRLAVARVNEKAALEEMMKLGAEKEPPTIEALDVAMARTNAAIAERMNAETAVLAIVGDGPEAA